MSQFRKKPQEVFALTKEITMQIVFAFVLLILGAASAQAETAQIDRIEITEVGIFAAQDAKIIGAPNSVTGTLRNVQDIKLAESTTQVPAQLGLRFGFRYKVLGTPVGATANLKFVIKFPEPGVRNPDTGMTSSHTEFILTNTLGEEPFTDGYGFDHPWELVPGEWIFEIWRGSRKLAEQSFTVHRP
jgi:hypothetical protein